MCILQAAMETMPVTAGYREMTETLKEQGFHVRRYYRFYKDCSKTVRHLLQFISNLDAIMVRAYRQNSVCVAACA